MDDVNQRRIFDGRHITISYNNVVDAQISFACVENECVRMTTYIPLTFIINGIMKTVSKDYKVALPTDKHVYLVSPSNPDRLHKLWVSKTPPPGGTRNICFGGPASAPAPKPKSKRRKLHEFHMY